MKPRRVRGVGLPHALALVVVLVASLLAGDAARGATTAPTFARADYGLFGNNYELGDFNGDGSLDLAGAGGPAAKVRLNNGAGAFGALAEYPVGGGNSQDLAAGDFNGDARLDLVLTVNDPQIGVSLLGGNGDGTFAAPVTFPNTSGFDSPAVDAVDLNNDGRLDVVIAHDIACYTAPCVTTDLISVMIGNGDGTFQPSRELPVGRGMSEIAVGDYNRDGSKDLAIGGTQGQVYLLQGVGDGTFVQQPTVTAVADTFFIPVTDIDAADFNGDSVQDLVVAVPHNGSRTAILIGNGDGTFRAPLVLTSPQLDQPQQQTVGDYNGDGFQDLALSLGDGSFGLMQIRNGNGGLVVSLSSSNAAAATVPATMTVHGGLSSGTFPVSTVAVPTTQTTTITASANGISRTAELTVTPPATPAALSAVSVNPSSVSGGTAAQAGSPSPCRAAALRRRCPQACRWRKGRQPRSLRFRRAE
jgi:hypothetical protein